jgi:hypothetical protein
MSHTTYELHYKQGHPYLEIEGELWLFDTGSPGSLGEREELVLGTQGLRLPRSYLGLEASALRDLLREPVSGLLGSDVLGRMDWLLDLPNGVAHAGENLQFQGQTAATDDFMGLPIVQVGVGDQDVRMIFDTGAQLSYWEDPGIERYRMAGITEDFFPGLGNFTTQAHHVPVRVADVQFMVRCGRLPRLLAATLSFAGVAGVLGSEILLDRPIGWSARRRELVIGSR